MMAFPSFIFSFLFFFVLLLSKTSLCEYIYSLRITKANLEQTKCAAVVCVCVCERVSDGDIAVMVSPRANDQYRCAACCVQYILFD